MDLERRNMPRCLQYLEDMLVRPSKISTDSVAEGLVACSSHCARCSCIQICRCKTHASCMRVYLKDECLKTASSIETESMGFECARDYSIISKSDDVGQSWVTQGILAENWRNFANSHYLEPEKLIVFENEPPTLAKRLECWFLDSCLAEYRSIHEGREPIFISIK